MRKTGLIGLLLGLSFMVACTPSVHVPEPVAPEANRRVEGPSPELSAIDSLMWQWPDSALMCLLPYFDTCRDVACNVYPENNNGDLEDVARYVSTNVEYNRNYANLLLSELLYKNNYAQTNRPALLQAVTYFDSLVGTQGTDTRGTDTRGTDTRGTDTRGTDTFDVSLQGRPRRDVRRASSKNATQTNVFLDARAHYMNGVGYYEHDSLVEACIEYLCALRTMEKHFAENEIVDKKARFMALTYNRLVEIFSAQFMQEPAIYCGMQAWAYNRIAPTSPYGSSKILYKLGKQYDKLNMADSASYYYDLALEFLPDRNNMVYRDIVSSRALFEYKKDSMIVLDSVKSMVAQAVDEAERLSRYLLIGSIYHSFDQDDSAKVYLEPVFEKDPSRATLAAQVLHEIAIKEKDTIKSNAYAQFVIEDVAVNAANQARVSKLSDLFQTYLQEKQESASLRERKKAVKTTLAVVLSLVVVLAVVVVILMRRRSKKRMAAHEAETHTLNEEKQQLQTQVDEAQQQARAMLLQRVHDFYRSKLPNRLERILAEFEAAYPLALERLAAAYPELSEMERQIAVLNFLHFRVKEEADLLGLSENTVNKYRSNLRKKTENASFSSCFDKQKSVLFHRI